MGVVVVAKHFQHLIQLFQAFDTLVRQTLFFEAAEASRLRDSGKAVTSWKRSTRPIPSGLPTARVCPHWLACEELGKSIRLESRALIVLDLETLSGKS
ncbi:MAG: hypothetical protein IVW51_12325 [Thermaceae bacterium]|nr:hypothetical protein [Thermaceae bacterium]